MSCFTTRSWPQISEVKSVVLPSYIKYTHHHHAAAWFTRPLELSGSKPCHGGSQIGDKPRQGKRQGQAAKQPDPPSWECNADITKIKAQVSRTLTYVSSTLSMTRHNLVNMVAITAVSGVVLLALLAARRF